MWDFQYENQECPWKNQGKLAILKEKPIIALQTTGSAELPANMGYVSELSRAGISRHLNTAS